MSQIVECGYSMKSFDLEKLQSITLSGEKITKEIFEALFINQSPYCFSTQTSGIYPYSYAAPAPYEDPLLPPPYKEEENLNMRNYEIFRGAFETAANCSKSAMTEIPTDYQYCDNRFYQGQQNYFQSF